MAAIVLLVAIGGASAFADEPAPQAPPFPDLLKMAEAAEDAPALEAVQPTDPEAASTLPLDNIGRPEAEDVFSAVFPAAAEAPAEIFDDLEVEKFNSDYTAVVTPDASSTPGAEPGLLTSTLPLRTETDDGENRLVDLHLAQVDGSLQPTNPIVETEIPASLEEGIALPESEVGIALTDAPERSPSNLDGSTAFYPNVAPDSDLAVSPTPTGVETYTVLRTPDAPHGQTFDLSLPAGAVLDPTSDGGAKITRGAEDLVRVLPPTALDATGEPVPVSLKVAGDTIALQVSPSSEATYPILVDPVYQTYSWYSPASSAGIEDWWPGGNSPRFTAAWIGVHNESMVSGLNLMSTAGSAFQGAQSNYLYYVPRYFSDFSDPEVLTRPTTFIKIMTLSQVFFWINEGAPVHFHPYLQAGLWDENVGSWTSIGIHTSSEGQYSNVTLPAFPNPQEVVDTKIASIALATGENWAYPRHFLVGAATLEISDKDSPAFKSLKSPGWVNKAPAAAIPYEVTDPGLGIYELQLKQPNFGGEMKEIVTSMQCVGSVGKPCPRTAKVANRPITYEPEKMPQGENIVAITAVDPIGHKSEVSQTIVKVDHSAPELVLTGTATEQASLGPSRPTYGLKVSAVDGKEGSPESGVAKAVVEFDGAVVAKKEDGCATKNCTASLEWTLDASKFAAGFHELKVTATDDVGIKVSKTIPIELEWVPPSLALSGPMTEQASLGTSRPRYNLKLNATAEAGVEVTPGTAAPSLVSSFGAAGSGDGQFTKPGDVALDAQGNLYVIDPSNNRVEVFNEKGEYLRKFGSTGAGNGQFNRPTAIAIDPKGNAWVVDAGNGRVQEFNSKGVFLKSIGSTGTGNGQFAATGPEGIAIAPTGTIFVSDTYGGRIEKFSEGGEFLGTIGIKGSGTGELGKPTGIDVGPGGKLWVSDCANSKVVEFEEGGTFVRQFGSNGTSFGQFKCPTSIVADARNAVWVADTEVSRIQEFNQRGKYVAKIFTSTTGMAVDGKANLWLSNPGGANGQLVQKWGIPFYVSTYQSSFGSKGTGDGQFSHPADVARDASGNLYVADQTNKRVVVFNSKGEYLRKFGSAGTGNGQFTRPTSIAIDTQGNAWVTDAGETVKRVEQFNSKGEYLKAISSVGAGQFGASSPEGIAIDSKGNIWVTDTKNGRVAKFNDKGEFVKVVGVKGIGTNQLCEPTGIDIGPGGKVWVTDYVNNKVVEFTEAGEALWQFGTAGAGDGQFSGPDAIAVDDRGDIWVGDLKNNRVQEFKENGEFVTKFGSTGSGAGQFNFGETRAIGLATDNLGNLWLTDAANNRIERWGQVAPESEVSTTISVDGKPVDTSGASCKAEKCPIAREWMLQSSSYSAGNHTVLAKATDGLGNVSTKTMTITVQPDTVKPTLQLGGELPNAPEGWVEQDSYSFNATATDGGYGVTSLALNIDGSEVASVSGACSDGACERTLTKPVSLSGYSGGAHTASVVATDGAGNTATKGWTINVDPSGEISVEEAAETLEAAEETSDELLVSPPDPSEVPGQEFPTLVDNGATLDSVHAPVEANVSTDPADGFVLQTSGGPVGVEPVAVDSSSSSLQAAPGAASAISTNTSQAVDTVVRPLYDGAMTFQAIRDRSSPQAFSWEVDLGEEQHLEQINSGMAEVYFDNGIAAFGIRVIAAHDASGTTVPTTLSVGEGKVVTLTVHHQDGNPAAGGVPFVYPITAGTGWEGGFKTEVVQLPPGQIEDPEQKWQEYSALSPPEPVDASDSEASASGFGGKIKRHFLHVECSHTAGTDILKNYEDGCGNPFQNKPGSRIAFRAAMHGKFFQREGRNHSDFLVWHEGGPTDSIGCVAEAAHDPAPSRQRRAHQDKCVWWGATADGGGAQATWGNHITPVARATGETRGSCGDDCGGSNPWEAFQFPPMAFYLWANGHYAFHQTDCIDCD